MKKILSVAAAGAMLAATSAVAFAAADNAVIDAAVSGDAVEKGTVTVTLSVSSVQGAPGIISGTIKTSGLKLTNQKVSSKMTTVMGAPAIENNVLMLMPVGTAAKGDEVITLTYEITAAAGENVSFEFAPDATLDMSTTAGKAKWNAKAASAETSDPGTSDTGTSDTSTSDTGTSDTGTSDTGSSDTGTSDTGSSDSGSSDTGSSDTGTSDSGNQPNPDTGFALAFVPIILASGAAVLVSRKKK